MPPPQPQVERNIVKKELFCQSHNDPHMKTLADRFILIFTFKVCFKILMFHFYRGYEFQKEGTYVLFEMGKDLFVSIRFDCDFN